MDKAEALAYVSRLFDAAQAGAVLWGDKLLLKRFLEQCSRTGSKETQDGYRRELRHFIRWRHPLRLKFVLWGLSSIPNPLGGNGSGILMSHVFP